MNRRNIWEHLDFQCPIVGTCLTTAELRRIAVRAGLEIADGATDFELHSLFVGLSKRPERPARAVQKHLDRKYRRVLRRFLQTPGEGIWDLWREHADRGDIAGPFWAVMSHPDVPEYHVRRIYGEVHMLSHVQGAANRADLKRLNELEARNAELTETLAERKGVLRKSVAVWKERNAALERDLARERSRREAVERDRLSLRELLEGKAVELLSREREDLRRQAEDLARRLEAAEARIAAQATLLERGGRELSEAHARLDGREQEVAALEASLAVALEEGPACGGACGHPERCPCPRLRGKRVLYVGGRSGLRGHYQMLAERLGCELLHHDGGLEQSPHRLQQQLAGADAVICPVDCVSHEACAAVKKMCKHCLKPVLFARSSGLSSLAASLTELDRVSQ
ncbi:DUF2325 domain-containing protein [Desulfovibrio aminophilus]|nr:DUF2325 domain-containing protein [Desulfovibrio aminophilus]MCM0753760.1 DUF2325 domain-containing protein [Desulfovibrio aminophilus]